MNYRSSGVTNFTLLAIILFYLEKPLPVLLNRVRSILRVTGRVATCPTDEAFDLIIRYPIDVECETIM